MARTRKTFDVEEFRQLMNGWLRNSIPEYTAQRVTMACVLERVLMETGNYCGFRFTSPPIGEDETGIVFADETRREYL